MMGYELINLIIFVSFVSLWWKDYMNKEYIELCKDKRVQDRFKLRTREGKTTNGIWAYLNGEKEKSYIPDLDDLWAWLGELDAGTARGKILRFNLYLAYTRDTEYIGCNDIKVILLDYILNYKPIHLAEWGKKK